jgi:hypothetical protein
MCMADGWRPCDGFDGCCCSGWFNAGLVIVAKFVLRLRLIGAASHEHARTLRLVMSSDMVYHR